MGVPGVCGWDSGGAPGTCAAAVCPAGARALTHCPADSDGAWKRAQRSRVKQPGETQRKGPERGTAGRR